MDCDSLWHVLIGPSMVDKDPARRCKYNKEYSSRTTSIFWHTLSFSFLENGFLLIGRIRPGRVRVERTGGYQREPSKADEIPWAIGYFRQQALLSTD